MRLVQGGGAANLQLIQALSDSEEEHDSAWDGRLGDRYNPPGKTKGNLIFFCGEGGLFCF